MGIREKAGGFLSWLAEQSAALGLAAVLTALSAFLVPRIREIKEQIGGSLQNPILLNVSTAGLILLAGLALAGSTIRIVLIALRKGRELKALKNTGCYLKEYSRGGLLWRVWMHDTGLHKIQSFCPDCKSPVRSPEVGPAYCLNEKCGKQFCDNTQYMELFKDIKVASLGDFRSDKRGFVPAQESTH